MTVFCPGLTQYLKGERWEGITFFVVAIAGATAALHYGLEPTDPYGQNAARAAIGLIVLFWAGLFSLLDQFQRRGRSSLYLILLPPVLLFSVFTYYPILWSIQISFLDHDLGTVVTSKARFVGTDNFAQIVEDDKFWLGVHNTLKFFLIGFVLGQFPAPILAGLLHSVKNRHLQTAYKALCFIPALFAWPIIGGIWLLLLRPGGHLDALAEPLLTATGRERIPWLGDPAIARVVFVCVGLWASTGSTALIWLASLAGIDPVIYEAASIDGARRWGVLRYITIPLLIPTWVVLTILSFIGMFAIFDQVVVMWNPQIRESVFVVMVHIYEQGIRDGKIGYASAMSLLLTVVVLTLTVINIKISKRFETT